MRTNKYVLPCYSWSTSILTVFSIIFFFYLLNVKEVFWNYKYGGFFGLGSIFLLSNLYYLSYPRKFFEFYIISLPVYAWYVSVFFIFDAKNSVFLEVHFFLLFITFLLFSYKLAKKKIIFIPAWSIHFGIYTLFYLFYSIFVCFYICKYSLAWYQVDYIEPSLLFLNFFLYSIIYRSNEIEISKILKNFLNVAFFIAFLEIMIRSKGALWKYFIYGGRRAFGCTEGDLTAGFGEPVSMAISCAYLFFISFKYQIPNFYRFGLFLLFVLGSSVTATAFFLLEFILFSLFMIRKKFLWKNLKNYIKYLPLLILITFPVWKVIFARMGLIYDEKLYSIIKKNEFIIYGIELELPLNMARYLSNLFYWSKLSPLLNFLLIPFIGGTKGIFLITNNLWISFFFHLLFLWYPLLYFFFARRKLEFLIYFGILLAYSYYGALLPLGQNFISYEITKYGRIPRNTQFLEFIFIVFLLFFKGRQIGN